MGNSGGGKNVNRRSWLSYILNLITVPYTNINLDDKILLIRNNAPADTSDATISLSTLKEMIENEVAAHASTHEIGGSDEINIDGGTF